MGQHVEGAKLSKQMKFTKYHALGNDYLVIHPNEIDGELSPQLIRLICHRNYGIGSDGILLGPLPSQSCDFQLKIFNPDGSEAEKSGNGLRIFARFLWDEETVGDEKFSVETLGGAVACLVQKNGQSVEVEMGLVCFDSAAIPVAGTPHEVLEESFEIDGEILKFCAASVGNPHCVVLVDDPTSEMAHRFGPLVENHPSFPNRTNVQFMKVLNRQEIQIEIWERGAGYTLASGSSSTAAAGVARKLGLCDSEITVRMPGGSLQIQFDADFYAKMTGPVTKVCSGSIASNLLYSKS